MEALRNTHPILCEEWDVEFNKTLTPEDVTQGSHQKVWWKCPVAEDHRWQTTINNRVRGPNGEPSKCPYCQNRKVAKSNCLVTTHPEMSKQWSVKNELKPTEITQGYSKKVWWQCDKGDDHIWEATVISRTRNDLGCPFCSRQKASNNNNLALEYPAILEEWDYEKNTIKPTEILPGSTKKIWWKCFMGHSWEATPNNRTSKGHACPYCVGRKADCTTSLLFQCAELCEQWAYDLNGEVKPDDLLPNSHTKVWWRCEKDTTHVWRSSPNNRVSNSSDCPHCQMSLGEKRIVEVLKGMGVKFTSQYKFADCRNKKELAFDFALHCPKLGLIEFQGGQHYLYVPFYGDKEHYDNLIIRDYIKKEYCKNNNITLLEIHYNDINNIPTLIKEFVKELNS